MRHLVAAPFTIVRVSCWCLGLERGAKSRILLGWYMQLEAYASSLAGS